MSLNVFFCRNSKRQRRVEDEDQTEWFVDVVGETWTGSLAGVDGRRKSLTSFANLLVQNHDLIQI